VGVGLALDHAVALHAGEHLRHRRLLHPRVLRELLLRERAPVAQRGEHRELAHAEAQRAKPRLVQPHDQPRGAVDPERHRGLWVPSLVVHLHRSLSILYRYLCIKRNALPSSAAAQAASRWHASFPRAAFAPPCSSSTSIPSPAPRAARSIYTLNPAN